MLNTIKSSIWKLYYSKPVNKYAVKMYTYFRPPPYRCDNMEFELDIWNGISCFHGQQGRQIGENNTAPEEYKEVIDTVHNECKFEGSRNGLQINMTALRHVMAVWDDALQLTTALRNDFMRYRNIDGLELNLVQGYAFSKIGAALPAYLAQRTDDPLKDGDLAPLETAFFTLGVGVFMTVRKMMEAGDLTVLEPDPMTALRLYELTDNSGALVTPAGKGCAGSKKLIIEFLDMAMNGTYEITELSPDAKRAIDLIGDMPRFYQYLFAASRLELYVKLNQYFSALSLFMLNTNRDALNDDQKNAVDGSLEYFVEQFGQKVEDEKLIRNMIHIVLALLEEMDDKTIRDDLLGDELLVRDEEGISNCELKKIESINQALDNISKVTSRLFDYSQKELDTINEVLGKKNVPSITLDKMFQRASGPYIQDLLN